MFLFSLLKIRALIAAMRLPEPVFRPLIRVPETVDGQTLDPLTRWFLTLVKLDRVPRETLPLARQRAEIDFVERRTAGPVRPGSITDTSLHLGGRKTGLRVYTPPGPARRPGLLFLHGGGWTVGKPAGYDTFCSRLAADADCVVFSLDYRLAPDHPYPAAIDDAEAAFLEIQARATEWGVDPTRLAVGGDSAGGNLSAVLANQWPEKVAFALLIYPGVDLMGDYPSMKTFARGFYLSSAYVHWFEDQYVPLKHQRSEPRVSPIRAEKLGNVPTLVVTAGLDPLRDSGRAYAARLSAAGIPSELLEIPGMVHGFVTMDGVLPVADRAITAMSDRLRAALAQKP